MSGSAHRRLEEVVLDALFPEVDLALRRGRHVGREDGPAWAFLVDALDHLEPFYRRYGCELIQSDGWFHLQPTRDDLGRRHLTVGEMLVGQSLALLYLDPATLREGGRVDRVLVLDSLQRLVGGEVLIQLLNPRRKRRDDRLAEATVREEVDRALRGLAALGFIDLEDDRLRLRAALMRFAEPVRGLGDPAAALASLVSRGAAVMVGEPTEIAEESAGEEEEP
jgi:chromosome partition protein MukE